MKSYGVTIQMKPLLQYFHMVLFISFVVLTFESVNQILWCYHSNKTSSAVLSHGTIHLVCSSNFWVCGWNPMMWPFKWNLFASTVLSQGTVCHSAFYKKKFGMFLSVYFGSSGSERVKMTAEIGYKIWIGLQLNMARYRWGVLWSRQPAPRVQEAISITFC